MSTWSGSDTAMKCAVFPAANGGSMLVIQPCSGVNDGTGTGSGRCSSNSVYRATIHFDNDGTVSKETCYKQPLLVLLDQCRSTKIDRHRFNLQWTGGGSESVP